MDNLGQIISGWFAYILMDNSVLSFLFVGLIILISILFWKMQRDKNDTFDLKDIICKWDSEHKKQIVATDKSLLTGAFLVSSYYVVHNISDTAYAAYLSAWVLNGGIAVWHRSLQKKEEPK
jgi:hypothetical protein